MPEPLTSYNIELWGAYNVLSASMNTWRNTLYSLGDAILANNWAQAKVECTQLGDEFSTLVRADLCDSSGIKGKTHQSLNWINDNWGAGDVTMDGMLTAMLSATSEQLTTWMGITDAYTVAVWDAPFNAEYYAALARGFKTW